MRLVLTRHVTKYTPGKTGEYPIFPSDIPQFSCLTLNIKVWMAERFAFVTGEK